MKQLMAIGLVWLAGWTTVRAADETFSRAVGAADFSAAGLSKLSPEELARLDALVRDYKTGALAAAQREVAEARAAAAATVAKAEAETQAAKADAARAETARAEAAKTAQAEAAKAKKAEGGSLLQRAKVLLTPGTEIEYATVESKIVGKFIGWGSNTVFTLENGQRWKIANGGSYTTPPVDGPNVKIEPGSLGGFWMKVEGVSSRVRVAPFGAK
jgi:hypothetical protein